MCKYSWNFKWYFLKTELIVLKFCTVFSCLMVSCVLLSIHASAVRREEPENKTKQQPKLLDKLKRLITLPGLLPIRRKYIEKSKSRCITNVADQHMRGHWRLIGWGTEL